MTAFPRLTLRAGLSVAVLLGVGVAAVEVEPRRARRTRREGGAMSFFGTLFGEIADLFGIQPKNRPGVGSVWVEKDPRFDDERTTVRVLNVGREMVRYCVVEPEKPKGPDVPPPQPDCAQVCYIRSFLRYYAPAGGRAGR